MSLCEQTHKRTSVAYLPVIVKKLKSVACGIAAALCLCAPGCELLQGLHKAPLNLPTQVGLALVADGLTSPLGMAMPGDGTGRLFVVDQIGLIRIIEADGDLLETPFLDLADRMVGVGIDFGGGFVFDERGLLGLAFHPDYAENGRFFVFYTAPKGDGVPEEFDSETHVSEFRVSDGDPNLADPDSERIVLVIPKPQFNHNGGQLAFGPDGMLYIAVGDGGNANDEGDGHTPGQGNGQDRSRLLGKILRIDVDGDEPYEVPVDNPFGAHAAFRPEIFADGFRNPWRFSFDVFEGVNRLFVADVGQDLFEEVNIVEAGQNYGWRIREGFHCFDPENPSEPLDECPCTAGDGRLLIDPIFDYPHMDDAGGPRGIAVIGGFVYRGMALPSSFAGRYVFADFSTSFGQPDGSLFVAGEDECGDWGLSELSIAGDADGRLGRFVLGMGRDEAGEVYLLTSGNLAPSGNTGRVHRLVAGE